MPPPCRLLDDYLAHALVGAERADFLAHLSECPSCDGAVAEAAQLAALLSAAAERLEPLPVGLTDRIRHGRRVARRRRVAAAAGALAAAAAVVLAVVHFAAPPPVDTEQEPPAVTAAPPPGGRARVSFPPDASVLAVPVPTDSPNVTVLLVYPGLRAATAPPERSN